MSSKPEFRKNCIQTLLKASKRQPYFKQKNFQKNLSSILYVIKPSSILFYLPMSYEPDVTFLVKKLRRQRVKIFTPFIEDVSFKMVPYRLPQAKRKYRFDECGNSFLKTRKVHTVIVPTIGVDKNFKRIGQGKGMYDRFFSTLSSVSVIIFVQLQKCVSKHILTEPYDTKGDFLVTANEIIARGRHDIRNYRFVSRHSHTYISDFKKVRCCQVRDLC